MIVYSNFTCVCRHFVTPPASVQWGNSRITDDLSKLSQQVSMLLKILHDSQDQPILTLPLTCSLSAHHVLASTALSCRNFIFSLLVPLHEAVRRLSVLSLSQPS